jgi:ABC-type dipeptide/oligopeptide/nickel transport system ATPase component
MQLRYKLLYLFIAVGSLITAAGQQQYTLLECIEIALENNRDIKQQELNKQQRMVAYSQARADLLPAVNASAGHNFIFGRSIGLDNTYQNTNSSQSNFNIVTDITLFDGLRMKHNIDARKADMMVSEANLERIQDEIIMSVSTAFLQALLNRELLTIAENQIQTTRENLKRSTELVNSGKMAKGELYEIEAQLAKEEVNRVQAENNYKLALLDLAQIMELEKFDDFEIVSPPAEALIDENCHGKRYNRETLEVRFKGKSIADVLDMTINVAVEFFENVPSILHKIKVLQEVGLGYIKLGQSSTTLSGGESQRVKLATELARTDTGNTMYVLDEPTTGLHFEDIRVLLTVLNKLVEKGNSVIVIEHNLDIIKCADYIIDLGPEGGERGGYILTTGTPEEIVKNRDSYTAVYLREELVQ